MSHAPGDLTRKFAWVSQSIHAPRLRQAGIADRIEVTAANNTGDVAEVVIEWSRFRGELEGQISVQGEDMRAFGWCRDLFDELVVEVGLPDPQTMVYTLRALGYEDATVRPAAPDDDAEHAQRTLDFMRGEVSGLELAMPHAPSAGHVNELAAMANGKRLLLRKHRDAHGLDPMSIDGDDHG